MLSWGSGSLPPVQFFQPKSETAPSAMSETAPSAMVENAPSKDMIDEKNSVKRAILAPPAPSVGVPAINHYTRL